MELEALERQTGAYGVVNAGDTVTVDDITGDQLLKGGCFKKAKSTNETATPDEVSARNDSGIMQESVHMDATNREILNTDGRKLHESGPDATIEAAARVQAEVTPDLDNVLISKGDGETTEKAEKKASERKTKEDKAATGEQTK